MRSHNGSNGYEITSTSSRLQWQKLASLVLVMVILNGMVGGVSDVVRGLNLDLAWSMVGVGLFVSIILIRFGKLGWTTALFTFFSGLLMSSMMVGRLWDDWQTLWNNLIWWFGTLVQAFVKTVQGQFVIPSFGTLFIYMHDFSQSVFVMLQRFVLWVVRFPSMNNDLISILMVWSLFMWLATIWTAWHLWRRRRPLVAVLPAILLVALARSYSDASSNVMLVMLGASVALMVFFSQVERERDWEARGIGFSELIRKNSTQAALTLSAILVLLSGGITSIDVEQMKERWEEFTRRREPYSNVDDSGISSSLGIEQDASRVTLAEQFSKLSQGGLPSSHLVGSGPELAEEVVFVAQVEETEPRSGDPAAVDPASPTYYFRSLAYDKYTSQGWYATSGKIYVYRNGQEAVTKYTNRQQLVKQAVRFEDRLSTSKNVYVVGDLAVVNRLYNVYWREGENLAEFNDIFGATLENWSYEAYSVVPVFSEVDLRESSLDYPDWILRRYLQLPETVPERVVNLSYEITSQELNAYDKAVAIEQYLRKFPYTLELPIRTANRDIADYFLFDLQRGYCDYYASTMVVLARAAGIPARLAVGYLGSTYDLETERYVVTADQAHSWVEIFFPEYGWVTFEPTAGRAPLTREAEEFDLPEFDERQIIFAEEKLRLSGLEILGWSVLGLVGLAVLSFMIWLRLEIFILRRQSIDAAFAKIYRRMLFLGRLLGVQHGIAQTPLEFSAEMIERIEALRNEHRTLAYLEKTGKNLESLVVLANKAAYRAEAADAFERAKAVDLWVKLRRQLGLAIFWEWLRGLLPKVKRERAIRA